MSATYRFFAIAGLLGLSLSLVDATPAAATTIDFDAVDTSTPPALGVDPTSYLAGFGASLTNVTGTTTMGIKNPSTFDTNLILLSDPNYMSQWWNGISGVSYDLMFDQPLESLYVSIPQITSGVIVPAWSFTALDSGGNLLTTSYGQAGTSGASARRTFEFLGTTNAGLQGIRVFSNVFGVAGMGGIPIDDVEFTLVPEPSTLLLAAFGLLGIACCQRKRT